MLDHVGIDVSDYDRSRDFYERALPGIRQLSHPNYNGAYMLDPDGNNIETVSHGPE